MVTVEFAARTLFDTIAGEHRHKHYQRTVELADLYLKLYTGEGAEDLLKKITSREDDTEFKERKKHFHPLTPAICKKARVPFAKVPKADGVVDEITYDGGDGQRRDRLDKALDEFFGEENLDDYMADRFLDLNLTDPNAYVIVDFGDFDPVREVAVPYPVEVSSAQCINKSIANNTTEWIIGEFDHSYTQKETPNSDKEITMPGKRYVMYFGQIYDARQVEFDGNYSKKIDPKRSEQFVNIESKSFEVRLLSPFSERQTPEFQGICVGHVKDPVTKGETFVSVLHNAKYRLLSSLKAGSEHGLTMALAAHPQVFQYLPACPGTIEDGITNNCRYGKDENGETCRRCEGSGKVLPTSVQHATTFALDHSRLDEPDKLLDLSKLKHYSSPDTAIIKILWDYIREIEQSCLHDIFTSASLESKPLETATRVAVDEESQNNAVYPFARKWATVKIKLTRIVSMFVDADKGLQYTCKVPSRLQLAPVEILLERAKKAKDLNDPVLYEQAQRDIIANRLTERPLELRKYEVQREFRPMEGTSDESKRMFFDILTLEDKILLAYETEIYAEMDTVENFYYMDRAKQRELIDIQVATIKARIEKQKAAAVDFAQLLMEGQGGVDGEEQEEEEFEQAA